MKSIYINIVATITPAAKPIMTEEDRATAREEELRTARLQKRKVDESGSIEGQVADEEPGIIDLAIQRAAEAERARIEELASRGLIREDEERIIMEQRKKSLAESTRVGDIQESIDLEAAITESTREADELAHIETERLSKIEQDREIITEGVIQEEAEELVSKDTKAEAVQTMAEKKAAAEAKKRAKEQAAIAAAAAKISSAKVAKEDKAYS